MCACVCVYSLTVLPIGLFPRSFLIRECDDARHHSSRPFGIQKPPGVETLT